MNIKSRLLQIAVLWHIHSVHTYVWTRSVEYPLIYSISAQQCLMFVAAHINFLWPFRKMFTSKYKLITAYEMYPHSFTISDTLYLCILFLMFSLPHYIPLVFLSFLSYIVLIDLLMLFITLFHFQIMFWDRTLVEFCYLFLIIILSDPEWMLQLQCLHFCYRSIICFWGY